jgi:membrane protease subunit (stomatin/prohibitin family)
LGEYHEISFHTDKLAELLNEALTAKWAEGRGLEIVNFGITCTASPEDEERIKQLQTAAVMRDPTMAAASLVSAQGDAMRTAAGNTGGAMHGSLGMGMAGAAGGMNSSALFQMGQQQTAPAGPAPAAATPAPSAAGWDCACGHKGNSGKFCAECGKPMPATWDCPCGHKGNCGKFCAECGKPMLLLWTCSCGHADNSGKFCADCGKPMPTAWDCACGHKGNTGKFCADCGKPMPVAWDCECGHKGNSGKFCADCGKAMP